MLHGAELAVQRDHADDVFAVRNDRRNEHKVFDFQAGAAAAVFCGNIELCQVCDAEIFRVRAVAEKLGELCRSFTVKAASEFKVHGINKRRLKGCHKLKNEIFQHLFQRVKSSLKGQKRQYMNKNRQNSATAKIAPAKSALSEVQTIPEKFFAANLLHA